MLRLTIVNSYDDRTIRRVIEEGRWIGMTRGMAPPCPYDMNAQETLALAWMHGQWWGSMGRDRRATWKAFTKTDGYNRPPCAVSYRITEELLSVE